MDWFVALQRSFIFSPDPTPPPPAGRVFVGGQDVELATDDGLTLGAWLIPPPPGAQDRRTAVLYAPGNGGQRAGRATLLAELAQRGFTVLALDYRGYGGNPGEPSQEGLASDARAGADLLLHRGFDPERTLYVGESLGTAVVAQLASTYPPAGLVLRSPFTSVAELAAVHFAWLPLGDRIVDTFDVLGPIGRARMPVAVIRGTADGVVPPELSARVAAAAPRLAEELVLPGVGHNDDVMFGPVVADVVTRLADTVAPS